jgi:hypothetical protein
MNPPLSQLDLALWTASLSRVSIRCVWYFNPLTDFLNILILARVFPVPLGHIVEFSLYSCWRKENREKFSKLPYRESDRKATTVSFCGKPKPANGKKKYWRTIFLWLRVYPIKGLGKTSSYGAVMAIHGDRRWVDSSFKAISHLVGAVCSSLYNCTIFFFKLCRRSGFGSTREHISYSSRAIPSVSPLFKQPVIHVTLQDCYFSSKG